MYFPCISMLDLFPFTGSFWDLFDLFPPCSELFFEPPRHDHSQEPRPRPQGLRADLAWDLLLARPFGQSHRCSFWLFWSKKDCDSWFARWFNHLPGPSLKGHLWPELVARVLVEISPVWHPVGAVFFLLFPSLRFLTGDFGGNKPHKKHLWFLSLIKKKDKTNQQKQTNKQKAKHKHMCFLSLKTRTNQSKHKQYVFLPSPRAKQIRGG